MDTLQLVKKPGMGTLQCAFIAHAAIVCTVALGSSGIGMNVGVEVISCFEMLACQRLQLQLTKMRKLSQSLHYKDTKEDNL